MLPDIAGRGYACAQGVSAVAGKGYACAQGIFAVAERVYIPCKTLYELRYKWRYNLMRQWEYNSKPFQPENFSAKQRCDTWLRVEKIFSLKNL